MDLNYNESMFKETYNIMVRNLFYKNGKYKSFVDTIPFYDAYPTWVEEVLADHGYILIVDSLENIFFMHINSLKRKWVVFTSHGIALDINEGDHPIVNSTRTFLEILLKWRRELFIDLLVSAKAIDDVPLIKSNYSKLFSEYFNRLTPEEQLYIELKT